MVVHFEFRQAVFQSVTTGDVKCLKFLEESKQPFRLLRIVANTFQQSEFALTINVPFTRRDMATGDRKVFPEGGALPDV